MLELGRMAESRDPMAGNGGEDRILSGFFKILSTVDLPKGRSHQHEIGIPNEFRYVFEPELHGRTPVSFFFFQSDDVIRVDTDAYYYDVRQNTPTRKSEFRLYYSKDLDDPFGRFRAGDTCAFVKDINHQLYCFIVRSSSDMARRIKKDFTDHAFSGSIPVELSRKIDATSEFRVLNIREFKLLRLESMGTKAKGWYIKEALPISGQLFPEISPYMFLWKTPQGQTGEHWAEKVAFELACLVGIRAASVEFGVDGSESGVLSRSFVDRKNSRAAHKAKSYQEFQSGELTHGNQLLGTHLGAAFDLKLRTRKQKNYTLQNIRGAIESLDKNLWPNLRDYLIFDCWIGNLDRHHENWGVIRFSETKQGNVKARYILAPSYDHGPAFASGDSPERRGRFMAGDLRDFYRRARCLIHRSDGERSTFPDLIKAILDDARGHADEMRAIRDLVERIAGVAMSQACSIVSRIPSRFMGDGDKEFCVRYLEVSREMLLEAIQH